MTTKTIDALKPPKGRMRIDVRDDLLVGMSLRVSQSGRKVFYLIKRIGGCNTRIRLGEYPVLQDRSAGSGA